MVSWSHLIQVCGLKPGSVCTQDPGAAGHTLYRCVDWNQIEKEPKPWEEKKVTPYTGVWIETRYFLTTWQRNKGHTLYRCVDWNPFLLYRYCLQYPSHTLYRCVDWNVLFVNGSSVISGHTLYRCVDWNINIQGVTLSQLQSHLIQVCGLKLMNLTQFHHPMNVTPYTGVWIETASVAFRVWLWRVTPYTGVWIETSDLTSITKFMGHTLYRCVDWNKLNNEYSFVLSWCHTLYRCVDWNSYGWRAWLNEMPSHLIQVCGLKLS